MIRFYLLVLGAIAGAVAYVYGRTLFVPAVFLSFLGALAAYCFYRLDTRVSDLVKIGEEALKGEELRLAGGDRNPALNMCATADAPRYERTYPYTYRENIKLLLLFVALLFLLTAVASFTSAYYRRDVLSPAPAMLDY